MKSAIHIISIFPLLKKVASAEHLCKPAALMSQGYDIDLIGFDPCDISAVGFEGYNTDLIGFDPCDISAAGFEGYDIDLIGFDPCDISAAGFEGYDIDLKIISAPVAKAKPIRQLFKKVSLNEYL
jgi:hypothetical protein